MAKLIKDIPIQFGNSAKGKKKLMKGTGPESLLLLVDSSEGTRQSTESNYVRMCFNFSVRKNTSNK